MVGVSRKRVFIRRTVYQDDPRCRKVPAQFSVDQHRRMDATEVMLLVDRGQHQIQPLAYPRVMPWRARGDLGDIRAGGGGPWRAGFQTSGDASQELADTAHCTPPRRRGDEAM
ncbi:hypothetical protein D3C71_1827200 [compost metagenome]